jgi:hypothetical protein
VQFIGSVIAPAASKAHVVTLAIGALLLLITI